MLDYLLLLFGMAILSDCFSILEVWISFHWSVIKFVTLHFAIHTWTWRSLLFSIDNFTLNIPIIILGRIFFSQSLTFSLHFHIGLHFHQTHSTQTQSENNLGHKYLFTKLYNVLTSQISTLSIKPLGEPITPSPLR